MPRYTIDVGEKFDALVTSTAEAEETTKSEIIRRAIACYTYLKEQAVDGKKVAITDASGAVLKEVVLP